VDDSRCGKQFDPLLGDEASRPAEHFVSLPQASQFHLYPGVPGHGRERAVYVADGPSVFDRLGEGHVRRRQVAGGPQRITQANGSEDTVGRIFIGQQ
jgi:hypothetical protein